jgi:hypothetical protein
LLLLNLIFTFFFTYTRCSIGIDFSSSLFSA